MLFSAIYYERGKAVGNGKLLAEGLLLLNLSAVRVARDGPVFEATILEALLCLLGCEELAILRNCASSY